jgi:hypothetical protein
MARELITAALAVLVAACGRGDAPGKSAAPQGPPLASKPFYRIDPGPKAPCASGSVCEARLVLTALGDYHVNKDYPFKFVADPAAAPVDGDGTFAFDDAQHGTMTVKFRPAAAGTQKLVGTFKLSVCNDNSCEIETPKLELPVPVS